MSTDILCAFVPRGLTAPCGAPRGSHRHSYRPLGRFGMGLTSHPFAPAGSVVNLDTGETFVPSREYLVDPIGQILCTFRLAGGPCGKDSFDTVHRAHTDHPGFCGVYTCHEFRPNAPEADKPDTGTDRLVRAVERLAFAIENSWKVQKDDGR